MELSRTQGAADLGCGSSDERCCNSAGNFFVRGRVILITRPGSHPGSINRCVRFTRRGGTRRPLAVHLGPEEGRVDAVFTAQVDLLGYAQEDKDLRLEKLQFGARDRFGIAVPKGDVKSCECLTKALKTFIAKGDWNDYTDRPPEVLTELLAVAVGDQEVARLRKASWMSSRPSQRMHSRRPTGMTGLMPIAQTRRRVLVVADESGRSRPRGRPAQPQRVFSTEANSRHPPTATDTSGNTRKPPPNTSPAKATSTSPEATRSPAGANAPSFSAT
jgi:hypothetical protein